MTLEGEFESKRPPMPLGQIEEILRSALVDKAYEITEIPDPHYRDYVIRMGQLLAPETLSGFAPAADVSYLSGVFAGDLLVNPGGVKIPGSAVYNYYRSDEVKGKGPNKDGIERLIVTTNLSQEDALEALKLYGRGKNPSVFSAVAFSLAVRRPVLAIEDGETFRLIIDTISNFDDVNEDFLDQIRALGDSLPHLKVKQTEKDGLIISMPAFALSESLVYRGKHRLKFPVIRYTGPLIMPGEKMTGYPTMAIQAGLGPDIYPLKGNEINPRQDDIDRILNEFTDTKKRHFIQYMRGLSMVSRRVLELMYEGKLIDPQTAISELKRFLKADKNHQMKHLDQTMEAAYQLAVLDPNPNRIEIWQAVESKVAPLRREKVKIIKEDTEEQDMLPAIQSFPLGEEVERALQLAVVQHQDAVNFAFSRLDMDKIKLLRGRGYPNVTKGALENVFFNARSELERLYPNDKDKRIIDVSVEVEEECLRIVVTDSGKGVPEDDLEKMRRGEFIDPHANKEMVAGVNGLVGGEGTRIYRTILGFLFPDSYVVGNVPGAGCQVIIRVPLDSPISL